MSLHASSPHRADAISAVPNLDVLNQRWCMVGYARRPARVARGRRALIRTEALNSQHLPSILAYLDVNEVEIVSPNVFVAVRLAASRTENVWLPPSCGTDGTPLIVPVLGSNCNPVGRAGFTDADQV